MNVVGTVNSFQEGTFYWEIENFSSLTVQVMDWPYRSPAFYFREFQCCLKFYPNSRRPHSVGFFTLYIFLHNKADNNLTNIVHVKLGIKTRSGCIEEWFSRNIVCPENHGLGLEDVIRRSSFFKRKSELAPSDCLTFVIFLSSSVPKLIKDSLDISVQTDSQYVEENESKETSKKKGSKKVVEDLGKLLTSGDKSDVVVHVKDTDFKVHGCILAARIPAFSALFEHETIEKASNEITITDCEPSIFEEFLKHIYTGSVRSLTTETVFGLYRVADQYLVDDLKEQCKKHVLDNLSIESFCGAIELALGYGERDLLQSAIDYFAVHFKLIIKTVEWQRFNVENPWEANEIFIKAFSSP